MQLKLITILTWIGREKYGKEIKYAKSFEIKIYIVFQLSIKSMSIIFLLN